MGSENLRNKVEKHAKFKAQNFVYNYQGKEADLI